MRTVRSSTWLRSASVSPRLTTVDQPNASRCDEATPRSTAAVAPRSRRGRKTEAVAGEGEREGGAASPHTRFVRGEEGARKGDGASIGADGKVGVRHGPSVGLEGGGAQRQRDRLDGLEGIGDRGGEGDAHVRVREAGEGLARHS